jgi:D-lactate dehydrogenase
MYQQLSSIFPAERLKTRLIDRYAFAGDASHFFLVPKAVVQPVSEVEVQQLFEWSHQERVPVTFRAGGTSLSGQSVTDGVLVDLSRYWRKVQPEAEGLQVRVQPAVIGSDVNTALKRFGRKMGPDPASITAAMMGGILSNNSSGMCCGVQYNAYHTLRHLRFMLPDGQTFDTRQSGDYERFEREAADLAAGLRRLRAEVLANKDLHERIRSKYQQKNTTGYSLNALVDYEHPLDIFAHLLIGAEGTLAFITEAVLDTLPDLPCKMTGMLWFESAEAACASIFDLKATGAEALEFMDRRALGAVENMKGTPAVVKTLPDGAAAILCEYQAATELDLVEKFAAAQPVLERLILLHPPTFTRDAAEQALYWKIRKGMYPSVASVRAKGTATMLEDLTFPVARLGAAITDVQALFVKYGYSDAIIFGHAKDGNLHFCISQSFATEAEVKRFEAFNDDLFDLVLKKYDGALKAEHGTGRAIAPYVEAEWGPEAYAMMCTIKQLADPEGLLNPDVIISKDKRLHLRDLKIMPVVEAEVDKCVECGYCERRCPSRDYTMTPRQRISVRRALRRLEADGDKTTHAAILKDYQHDGMDTCAVDGMCATDCPVSINTGELIKRLRRENHSPRAKSLALRLAKNFGTLEWAAKTGVRTGRIFNGVFGPAAMPNLTSLIRRVVPEFPLWMSGIDQPHSGRVGEGAVDGADKVIYFGSCISRMMDGEALQTFERLCKKANFAVEFEGSGRCCGQIFSSKGFTDAYQWTVNNTVEAIWIRAAQGKYPVVLDVTSCTQTILNSFDSLSPENQVKFQQIKWYDSIDFAHDVLLPRLNIAKPKDKIVFHPVCSAYKMGLTDKLHAVGRACAHEVVMPVSSGCCGMAGDRGFYHPGLISAATAIEAAEVRGQAFDGYYSSAKTCEMSLSAATGAPYQSVFTLLDEVSV